MVDIKQELKKALNPKPIPLHSRYAFPDAISRASNASATGAQVVLGFRALGVQGFGFRGLGVSGLAV